MTSPTLAAIGALLAADSSVSQSTRSRVLAMLHGVPVESGPRVVRRLDAAKRLGVSPRTVDNLANRGVLRRVKLGRATGFTVEELDRFCNGVNS